MADKKKTLADQIAALKEKRQALTASLAEHNDPSEHFAASVASQVTSMNQTIATLEGLNEDGSPKKSHE